MSDVIKLFDFTLITIKKTIVWWNLNNIYNKNSNLSPFLNTKRIDSKEIDSIFIGKITQFSRPFDPIRSISSIRYPFLYTLD